MSFDNRFALITLAKYRKGKDFHPMKLTTGSVDKYLYKLYEFKDRLSEKENLSSMLRTQLNELLSSFTIEWNGQQNILVPNKGHTVKNINKRGQRLLQVIPKDVRKVWQEAPIKNSETIVNVADGTVTITDKRITQLPDHLSWQTAHYIVMCDKEKELKDKLVKDQVVVISGAGGMGKSTLATNYGKELKRRDIWQVRWLKGMQIDEEFFQLAKDLNIKTTNLRPEEIRDLVYRELEKLPKEQQILLIFDNVEEKDKIQQYLVNLPNRAKVIITSRNGNILEGLKPIAVKGFNRDEAITYLREALGKSENDAEKLVATVGESPFRLSKAVAYLKSNSLMSVAQYISDYEAIKRGEGPNEEIYPEVKMLFGNLKNHFPESWQLLKYLAYLDAEGISVKSIANVMGMTERQLQKYVNVLENLSLLSVSAEGHQTVLKVSHRIVQSETKTALVEENKAQVKNILEALIGELNEEFPRIDDNLQISKSVPELIGHAKKLVEESKKISSPVVGIENLLAMLGVYHYRIALNSSEAMQYLEEALAYQRQIHKGNHPYTAQLLNIIGLVYVELGGGENIRRGIKCHEDSLMMRQALFPGENAAVAKSYSKLAIGYKKLGGKENDRKALACEKAALEMYNVLYFGNHPDKAKSLNSMGNIYVNLEGEHNTREGVRCLEEALKMRRKILPDDHLDIVDTLKGLETGYSKLGGKENLSKGLRYREEGLEMLQRLVPGMNPEYCTRTCLCRGSMFGFWERV